MHKPIESKTKTEKKTKELKELEELKELKEKKINKINNKMSNRLDSLNTKKTPTPSGSKSGLKFKPKVVQRKSKEEREKVAPKVKDESSHASTQPTRGRGGGARGRGRGGRNNNYAGTHLVTQGPLAAGSVSLGKASGSKLGLTSDLIFNSSGQELSTSEFIGSLKLKDPKTLKSPSGEGAEGRNGDDDEEEEDKTRINMTKEYRFEESETELFPQRPFRDDGIQRKVEETKVVEEPLPVKLEPSAENTPAVISISREDTAKSENIEAKIELIKENKAKLESKITQADSIVTDEQSKLITDHEQIIDLLTGSVQDVSISETKKEEGAGEEAEEGNHTSNYNKTNNNNKYVMFQLPHLPTYEREKSKVKLEPGIEHSTNITEEAEKLGKESQEEKTRSAFATTSSDLYGTIGKVNIHQSGKITISLGNGIKLNVTKGSPTDFLQELALLEVRDQPLGENSDDMDLVDDEGREVAGKLFHLGNVNDKIIATPCIE